MLYSGIGLQEYYTVTVTGVQKYFRVTGVQQRYRFTWLLVF